MNTPKIRFKGFKDDWEQRKVLDLLVQPVTDGPHETPRLVENGIPFISVDAIVDNKIDFSRKRGDVSEEYDAECCKKYKPQYHDVYVVKSGSTVGKVAIVETTDRFNIWSPLAALRCEGKTKPYYLFYLLQTRRMQAQILDKASNGTQPNLSMRELEKFDVLVTDNAEEQQRIGDYFKSLDHLITLHQRKCDETKELKKFMLQKMFPKNGEKNPEIRFDGFTDDWEQRKLGALMEDGIILEQSDGNHGELYPRSEEFVNEGIPYIAASSISSDGERIDFNLTKYLSMERAIQFRKGVAKNGDVLLAHNATVGPSVMLSMDYEFAILSTSLTLYRLDKEKMSPMFFLQAIRSGYFQKQLEVFMKQTTRSQVPILTQRNLQISYPINKVEQERIGEFLSNLDHLITLHQRKCEKLKELKKFMLQNMFV